MAAATMQRTKATNKPIVFAFVMVAHVPRQDIRMRIRTRTGARMCKTSVVFRITLCLRRGGACTPLVATFLEQLVAS